MKIEKEADGREWRSKWENKREGAKGAGGTDVGSQAVSKSSAGKLSHKKKRR